MYVREGFRDHFDYNRGGHHAFPSDGPSFSGPAFREFSETIKAKTP